MNLKLASFLCFILIISVQCKKDNDNQSNSNQTKSTQEMLQGTWVADSIYFYSHELSNPENVYTDTLEVAPFDPELYYVDTLIVNGNVIDCKQLSSPTPATFEYNAIKMAFGQHVFCEIELLENSKFYFTQTVVDTTWNFKSVSTYYSVKQ